MRGWYGARGEGCRLDHCRRDAGLRAVGLVHGRWMWCRLHGRRKEDSLVHGRREQCESGVCLERGMLGWCIEGKGYVKIGEEFCRNTFCKTFHETRFAISQKKKGRFACFVVS